MIRLLLIAALLMTGCKAISQEWGNLNALILPSLSGSGTSEATFWLPDLPDPATASIAVGVVYEYLPGSAGNTGIAPGFFMRQGAGWVFAGHITGLYGQSPRDVNYGQTDVELTTTMLGPNEPRCCPTMPVRWRINYQTRAAQRLN